MVVLQRRVLHEKRLSLTYIKTYCQLGRYSMKREGMLSDFIALVLSRVKSLIFHPTHNYSAK
jgi:hypothetical protein